MRTLARSVAVALPTSLLLALAACGSDDQAAPADDSPAAESTEDATHDPEPTEEDSTEQSAPSAQLTRSGPLDSASAAIETAESETGGTAFEIDFEEEDTDDDDDDDDPSEAHWSVNVIANDREWEVFVSEDGAEVLSSEDESADSDDQRDLDAAQITLIEALETAVGEVPGELDDASLDDDGGTLHWEISIYPEGEDRDTEVRVDAATGDIL